MKISSLVVLALALCGPPCAYGDDVTIEGHVADHHFFHGLVVKDAHGTHLIEATQKQIQGAGVKRKGDKIRVTGKRLPSPGAGIPENPPAEMEAKSIELLESNKPVVVAGVAKPMQDNAVWTLETAKGPFRMGGKETAKLVQDAGVIRGDKIEVKGYVFENTIFDVESVTVVEKHKISTITGVVEGEERHDGVAPVAVRDDATKKTYSFMGAGSGNIKLVNDKKISVGDRVEIKGHVYNDDMLKREFIVIESVNLLEKKKAVMIIGTLTWVGAGGLFCGPGWVLKTDKETFEMAQPHRGNPGVDMKTSETIVQVTAYVLQQCPRCKCSILEIASIEHAGKK